MAKLARLQESIHLDAADPRSSMHLDTVLTMIDVDAFTIYPDLRAGLVP